MGIFIAEKITVIYFETLQNFRRNLLISGGDLRQEYRAVDNYAVLPESTRFWRFLQKNNGFLERVNNLQ